ncbi:hypothetical protein [Pseudoalteromonas spongiae]|uniref:hypothetical protein n=1 Tax=Pseudoalteromonas spongiae TaxID=298657 RepID=UPI0014872A0F|nr:hypothetical protein [Pseudoalteromonas spongiae]
MEKTCVMIKPLFDTFAQLPYQIDYAQHHFNVGNYTHLSRLTQAQLDDLTFCLKYLQKVGIKSENSFNRFRNEIEKLLLWLWFKHNCGLASINKELLTTYTVFCQSPDATWCTLQHNARFKLRNGERHVNENWRPFKSAVMSYESRASMFTVLNHFCDALTQAAIIKDNPIKTLRKNDVILNKKNKPVTRSKAIDESMLRDAFARYKNDIHKMRNLFLLYLVKKAQLPLQAFSQQNAGSAPLLAHLDLTEQVLYVFDNNQLTPHRLCEIGLQIATCYKQLRGSALTQDAPLLHRERGNGSYEVRQLRRLITAMEKEIS